MAKQFGSGAAFKTSLEARLRKRASELPDRWPIGFVDEYRVVVKLRKDANDATGDPPAT